MKFEDFIAAQLSGLTYGKLNVQLPGDHLLTFGNPSEELRATVIVHDPSFLRDLPVNPWLCLGESYVDGKWDVEGNRLVDLLGMIWARRSKKINRAFGLLGRAFRHKNRRRPAKR